MKLKTPEVDRRTLLVGGGAGVGLVVAWGLWPRRYGSALATRDEEQAFGHYLKIGTDGRVTVAVPQIETGQGVWTALPQIAADELGAAWESVAVEPAPASPLYDNPLAQEQGWLEAVEPLRAWRLLGSGALRITAGATSVRAFERPLREAAATARAMLCQAAAARWRVAAAECDTQGGFVIHEGKRMPFGEVAEAAAEVTPPEQPALRIGRGKFMGQSLPRLDLPAKSDGSFRLGADVRVPGLVYASVRMAPKGGRLTGHDAGAARRTPGLLDLVATDEWLAAVAPTWWAAEQAVEAAASRLSGRAGADSAAMEQALTRALDGGEAQTLFEQGDIRAAVGSARPLSADYGAAPALHLGLEPLTATARFNGDRLEVWAPTQAPELARRAAAEAGGVRLSETMLYPMPVGGQGGRALEADAVPVAVALAKRLGRPVQVTLSRAQHVRHDKPRPPLLARMAALPNPAGGLAAWNVRLAGADGTRASMARLLGSSGEGFGPTSLQGAVPPYAIPHLLVEGVPVTLPIQSGYMRGEEHAAACFFIECFIDEMARTAGAEPLSYRMGMLSGNARLARAVSTAAAIGGWDGGGQGSSMGLACLSAYGSHIGLMAVANVSPEQKVEVSRLVAAVDCGRAVNPGLVRQQIEGGLIAGLAQATARAPQFHYGMAVAGSLQAPRLARTPQIEIELLPSTDALGGVSGLGFAVVAAAIANALASATGKRLRRLPLDPMSAA